MSGTLKTTLKIITWVIMGISIVLVLWLYFGPKVPGTEGTPLAEPVATNYALWWSYFLFALTVAITLIFALMNIFTNPGGAKKALFSIVGIGILIVIAYFLASDQILEIPGYEGTGNNPSTLKWVGTGLITMYLLAGIAFLSILYVEISRIFK